MSRQNITITVANSDDLPSNLHEYHQEKTIQPPWTKSGNLIEKSLVSPQAKGRMCENHCVTDKSPTSDNLLLIGYLS